MASAKLKSQRKTNNMKWATNTLKLRRVMDTMPNATEEELKAEYVKQGGLLNKEDTPFVETSEGILIKKKTAVKKVKEAVKKAVKKVTKKK